LVLRSWFSDGDFLLTSDFLHNRFSLIAHYESGRRTGISFVGQDGISEISIDGADLKATSNGKLLDLPALIGRTFVERRGRNRIVLESDDGLRLILIVNCLDTSQLIPLRQAPV
jgi:hypothetical protein